MATRVEDIAHEGYHGIDEFGDRILEELLEVYPSLRRLLTLETRLKNIVHMVFALYTVSGNLDKVLEQIRRDAKERQMAAIYSHHKLRRRV